MIRERNIQSATYTAGTTQVLDLPRDAVYHIIQAEFTGTVNVQNSATGQQTAFSDCFPFDLIKNYRLVRNGSDVVYQANGCMAAREHYYLNETFPHARLYTVSASLETLLLSSAVGGLGGKGITVPANDEGIGMTQVSFVTTSSSSVTSTSNISFDFQVDLYLQMGPQDYYFGSLVDARRLATFQLVLDYAAVTDYTVQTGTAGATLATTATGRILSYDQDNVATDVDYGTFKRSMLSFSNLSYASTNQQLLLTRGNYYHGVIFDCLAAKAASTTVLFHENAVFTTLINRINTNFQLRNFNWEDLQRKNQADGCANNAYTGSRGLPNGAGYVYYPVTGDRASELVPSHAFDQWDFLVNIAAITTIATNGANIIGVANAAVNGPENGATTAATNPTINLLLEEIIPGVNMGDSYPTAAQAGSRRATSAKPYAR